MDIILRTENIWKTYETSSVKVNALNGIDLAFAKGKFYAVIGRSGSGKSTLLNILSGLDVPTKGKVYFEGKDLSEYSDGKMEALYCFSGIIGGRNIFYESPNFIRGRFQW